MTTPVLGVALSLYTNVYFVVKLHFVFRYIAVNHTVSDGNVLWSASESFCQQLNLAAIVSRILLAYTGVEKHIVVE